MPSEPGWVKDMNKNIVRGNAHWRHTPPDTPAKIESMYRTTLSFNALTNLFEKDHGSDGDKSQTTFEAYYESNIASILGKFLQRMKTWEVYVEVAGTPPDMERFPIHDVECAKGHMEAAVQVAETIPGVPIKDLYLDTFYNHASKDKLKQILASLDLYRSCLKWICIPFLNYPRESPGSGGYRRPNAEALRVHLDGWNGVTGNAPLLPDGTPSKSMIGLRSRTMNEFIYYGINDERHAKMHAAARLFASKWNFFDEMGIVSRWNVISKNTAGPIEIWSSGNGYKCAVENGVRICKPSYQADFCVNNGTNVCP